MRRPFIFPQDLKPGNIVAYEHSEGAYAARGESSDPRSFTSYVEVPGGTPLLYLGIAGEVFQWTSPHAGDEYGEWAGYLLGEMVVVIWINKYHHPVVKI